VVGAAETTVKLPKGKETRVRPERGPGQVPERLEGPWEGAGPAVTSSRRRGDVRDGRGCAVCICRSAAPVPVPVPGPCCRVCCVLDGGGTYFPLLMPSLLYVSTLSISSGPTGHREAVCE